ncbi:MAG TPA: PAS domain S-box protein, partial [Anaerolineales bacterium]|nr:PAS domain S-box protein [Anaerolineales bacterium]
MKSQESRTDPPLRSPTPSDRKQIARLQHLEALLNSTLDAIVVVDEDQKLVLFNRAAEELFRCPADRALGTPLDRFIPLHSREKHTKLVRNFGRSADTRRTMQVPSLDLTCLRADGTEFRGDISISRHRHEGKPAYAAIIRDATARLEAERTLAESQATWRSLFDNMLEAVAHGRPEF